MVITILQEQRNRDGRKEKEKEQGTGISRIGTEGEQKKTLLELLRENGIYLDTPCNGRGSCGKCLVQYGSGAPEPAEQEKKKLAEGKLREGWRLACVSVPTEDCEILVPTQGQEEMAVETGFSCGEKKKGAVPSGQGYGVALDIGTTTLAAALIKISTGETCGNAVSVNHQRAYGADVISRIKAAREGKAAILQSCIREDVLALIEKLTAQAQIAGEQIIFLVIAGNTTMCHLLLGYSCEGLGKAPFTPVDISLQKKSWEEVFGNREYPAEVTVLPGFSAFVGADIVAGIYSTDLCGRQQTNGGEILQRSSGEQKTSGEKKTSGESCALLLDIGTNGEMALFAGDRLFVTSVAAGPAFEGGNISCGMAGVSGAVSRAVLFGRNRMVVKTVGNAKPEGLCGSGIIDVVYELVKHRFVDKNGILRPEFFKKGYPVVKDSIYFTQEDIRQVQMAKAAIHAGIELLLKAAGMQLSRVERVFLAGGFGTAIDIDKAAGIGLLPTELRRKVTAVGNSALAGAKCCLLEPEAGEKMAELAKTAQEINLALQPEFEETYLKRMQF